MTVTADWEGNFTPTYHIWMICLKTNMLRYDSIILIYYWARRVSAVQASGCQQCATKLGKKKWKEHGKKGEENISTPWKQVHAEVADSRGLKISEERVRRGQQRLRPAEKDSSQSPPARSCEVKFELSLRFVVIYLSSNRRVGACLNSALLSLWQKSTWGTTTCTVGKRKLNFNEE